MARMMIRKVLSFYALYVLSHVQGMVTNKWLQYKSRHGERLNPSADAILMYLKFPQFSGFDFHQSA